MLLDELQLDVYQLNATSKFHGDQYCASTKSWQGGLAKATLPIAAVAKRACRSCLRSAPDLLAALTRVTSVPERLALLEVRTYSGNCSNSLYSPLTATLKQYPYVASSTTWGAHTLVYQLPGLLAAQLGNYAAKTHSSDRWRYRAHLLPNESAERLAETTLRIWVDSQGDDDSLLTEVEAALEAAYLLL